MNWDENDTEEWNLLGFYYEYDDDLKQWRFFGNKKGLLNLSNAIISFANDKKNDLTSEHIHLGPYNYLKITNWHEPIINSDHIAGSANQLIDLGILIKDKISKCEVGNIFKIFKEYAKTSSTALVFFVMDNCFEPSNIQF